MGHVSSPPTGSPSASDAPAADNACRTIDLRSFRNAHGAERREAAEEFFQTAQVNGFLYLTGHGVPDELLAMVYNSASEFFAKSEEHKARYAIDEAPNHRGYVSVHETGEYIDEGPERRYEAFDMGASPRRQRLDPTNPLLGPNHWPDQPGFAWVMQRYMREMRRVSAEIATMIPLALGHADDALWRHMTNPVSQLRLLHYLPAATRRDAAVGMGAHTDYECFTLLHASSANLQILDHTDQWIDVPPKDGAFYFNIGDMCEVWTGGLLKATSHRVIDTGQERYSLPYFCATNYDTVVTPLVARDRSRRLMQQHYEPIHAGRHLLTQLLRDFAYLRHRADAKALPVNEWESSPFEARIREAL